MQVTPTLPLLLLVDDSADDIALAERALARAGVKADLRIARSGKEAWALLTPPACDAGRPTALFLDLNMPGWNGFDLLERVRADPKMVGMPVIVLTTSSERSDIERSYRLGANSFVTKPVDFRTFSQVFTTMSTYWLGINENL